MITPILMLGAGRMGGAILDGWRKTGAFAPDELIIVDPNPGEAAVEAAEAGVSLNPRVWLGHFELWEDGEIIFRHGMALMSGEQPSLAQAAAMIDVAVEGADRFYPAFDFLVQGSKSPKDAIAACMFETVGEA